MTVTGFAMVMAVYAYACYGGIRGYFLVAIGLHTHVSHQMVRTLLLYAWFLAFILVEIPIGAFFPLWLSEKWNVFEAGRLARTCLILFGCATLASSAWLAVKSKEGQKLARIAGG